MPKGEEFNRPNIGKAVRHFHLAFKGKEPEGSLLSGPSSKGGGQWIDESPVR
jgi:hypothetical protein